MNLDLADRETATEPASPDPSEPTAEAEESPIGLPLAACWDIEGSESGA